MIKLISGFCEESMTVAAFKVASPHPDHHNRGKFSLEYDLDISQ